MRPVWSGYISFGLVNIPVSLYSAEARTDIRFHLLDSRNKARIRYLRVNDETGAEVPWNKVVHAYEYDKDHYVIVKDEDFKKVSTAAKTIAIDNFVAQNEIGYEYFERPYYLIPEKDTTKSYLLLLEALKKSNKVAIAKIVFHEREHLVAIVPSDKVLILEVLRFAQDIRSVEDLNILQQNAKDVHMTKKENDMANQLIESMTEKWRPEQYHDDYREALMAWINSKAKGKKTKEKVVKLKATKESEDLVALMRQSLQALKSPRRKTNVVPLKRTRVSGKK